MACHRNPSPSSEAGHEVSGAACSNGVGGRTTDPKSPLPKMGNNGSGPDFSSMYNLGMPLTGYLRELRKKVGHDLLVLPSAAVAVRDEQGRVLMGLHSDRKIWVLPGGLI